MERQCASAVCVKGKLVFSVRRGIGDILLAIGHKTYHHFLQGLIAGVGNRTLNLVVSLRLGREGAENE